MIAASWASNRMEDVNFLMGMQGFSKTIGQGDLGCYLLVILNKERKSTWKYPIIQDI
jgi:hypothetical protein